jgi:transposase
MRGNSYSKISGVLGISRSTCNDIVQRFGERGDLRDRHSHGRPRILDECGDCEVVRMLNDPSNGTVAIVGRELRSQGLDLSDDTIRRSLERQGLQACVKTKKPLLTKKHKVHRYLWTKKCRHAIWMDWSYVIFFRWIKIQSFWIKWATILLEKEWRASFGPTCATYYQIWGRKYYGLEMHELGGSWQPSSHRRDYG